jgi:rubrerythrin
MEDNILTGLLQCNDCNNILTTLEDDCVCPICNNGNIEEILK